ncbi:MAG: 50S ribosomal protein L3 N(5)-glutamine methyltransferase [Pseudolabrys sp.]
MAKARRKSAPRELTTILDFVRYAVTRFTQGKLAFGQGTHDAVEEALFLVFESLGLPNERFESFLPATLTAAERQKVFGLIEERVRRRIPAANLLKRAWLQGVSFYVDERVIVPRSFIAELLYSDLFRGDEPLVDPGAVASVLELCTGSGCLAVLACDVFPNAAVDAVDLSADALKVAAINVEQYGLGDRIALMKGDLFAPVGGRVYDLIISNPPYVSTKSYKALPAEFAHEPRIAHAGGADGLDIVRRILAEAGEHLAPGGGLLCEVGTGRAILETEYPDLDFLWLDTERSAGEVFWLAAESLQNRG